jgi:hypothetical protein
MLISNVSNSNAQVSAKASKCIRIAQAKTVYRVESKSVIVVAGYVQSKAAPIARVLVRSIASWGKASFVLLLRLAVRGKYFEEANVVNRWLGVSRAHLYFLYFLRETSSVSIYTSSRAQLISLFRRLRSLSAHYSHCNHLLILLGNVSMRGLDM